MKIVVTGASGFIGSAFTNAVMQSTEHTVVALVRNTSARSLRRLYHLQPYEEEGRLHVINGDLNGDLSGLCEHADAVVNFAARTFVDHSIKDPMPFIEANVLGAFHILEDARRNKVKRFIQISTDEVLGSILEGAYREDARLNPTNVYSATKAGAEALAIAYAHTYGMHTTITRCENCYGPWQHPQKAFPVFVKSVLSNTPIPVYGDGGHVRQWLWVSDHVDAILHLLQTDHAPGEVFHVAGNQEITNLELAKRIVRAVWEADHNCSWTDTYDVAKIAAMIKFVPDHDIRPGHDRRYALNCDKLMKLGWTPKVSLTDGIKRAVAWYIANAWWMR
jgi:dTDP-glucose 4,6-dehydratase